MPNHSRIQKAAKNSFYVPRGFQKAQKAFDEAQALALARDAALQVAARRKAKAAEEKAAAMAAAGL